MPVQHGAQDPFFLRCRKQVVQIQQIDGAVAVPLPVITLFAGHGIDEYIGIILCICIIQMFQTGVRSTMSLPDKYPEYIYHTIPCLLQNGISCVCIKAVFHPFAQEFVWPEFTFRDGSTHTQRELSLVRLVTLAENFKLHGIHFFRIFYTNQPDFGGSRLQVPARGIALCPAHDGDPIRKEKVQILPLQPDYRDYIVVKLHIRHIVMTQMCMRFGDGVVSGLSVHPCPCPRSVPP